MNPDRRPSILILSSAESDETVPINNEFVDSLRARIGDELDVEWHNYHDIRLELTASDYKVFLRGSERLLSDFDFVYIKSYFRYSELAGAIVSYLENADTRYVCTELKNHIPLTKLTQLVRMSLNNLPIPKTVFLLTPEFSASYHEIVDKLGLPFIFKSIDGSTGEENFLVRDEETFQNAISQYPDLHFIAQRFIENDSDLRVLIVGKEIQLIIKRQRKDESTHLNNTSQGADAFLVPIENLSYEHQQASLKAAEIMGREIAGVDLLFEAGTGNPYFLEVNASPQIASGAFMDKKLEIYSNYFKNMVKYDS